MPVFLDDVVVDLDGERLGELIVAAQQRIEPTGRIIVEVTVGGDVIVGDALADRQDEDLGGREMHLYTAEPRELTLTILTQVRAELETLRQMQAQAAELLQQDQPAEALRQFGEALNVWMQAQQAVLHAAQVMSIDLDSLTVDEKTLTEQIEALRQQLEEVKSMIVSGDTVSLADALAYEWPQTVDAWDALIGELFEKIERVDPGP